jgi:undecaprenyl phosphate N,N'-diacetylbacillosamine 1-phosphate transferase
MYLQVIKPFLDILFTLLILPIILPIFLAVFLLLLVTNKGKVFFTQIRPGLYGKPFKVFKFKTLSDVIEGSDDLRATPVGKILRKTYLDELPQVLNILLLDMSWIGPRPLLMEYLDIYTPEQHQRHHVKPGITGLAQIKESKNAPISEKTLWDVRYVNSVSFSLDAYIAWRTILKILGR